MIPPSRSAVNMAFVRMHARMVATRERVTSSGAFRSASRATARSLAATQDRRRRRSRRVRAAFSVVIAALLLVGVSCRLHGQQWRTLNVARQQLDSSPLAVKVRYGTGRLTLAAAPTPYLYHMQLRYDAARAEPRAQWDAASRTVTLGVANSGVRWTSGRNTDLATMALGLSPSVPLDLSVEVGAAESTLDLSGLWLRTLDVRSGASATRIRFCTPSGHPVDRIEIESGAAQFTAERLANSGAKDVIIHGGLSLVELDLTGAWQRDMALSLDLAMGKGELTLPMSVGVRVTVDHASSMLRIEGLKKVGNIWESDGFASAAHKLVVSVHSSVSSLSITRR